MKTAAWILVGVLAGWLVRGIPSESNAPRPATPARVIVAPSEPIAEGPNVVMRGAAPFSSRGNRNLFAYREDAQPPQILYHAPPPPIASVVPTIVESPTPSAPPPVPFPYRYIGTFGPSHRRVAAFKRDNEIHTLFAGERLGAFTLRAIGMESVDVEGPDGVQRIPLTESL